CKKSMIKDTIMLAWAVLIGLALDAAFATTSRAQDDIVPFTSAQVTNCGSILGRGRQVTSEQAFRAGYLPSLRPRATPVNVEGEAPDTVRRDVPSNSQTGFQSAAAGANTDKQFSCEHG